MTTEVIVKVGINWYSTTWGIACDDAQYKIEEMRDWCIINLDVGTWRQARLRSNTISLLTAAFTFDCPEDATAFKIKFGV